MLAQAVPSLDRRNLAIKVNARREVKQLFDDGGTCRPGGVGLRRAWRARHQWRGSHQDVIGWVLRRCGWVGDV